MRPFNENNGQSSELYPKISPKSMAVNLRGDLFYSDETGQLMRTAADREGEKEIESDFFSDVHSLFYKSNELFFIGVDAETKIGLYMKPVVPGEAKSNVIVTITDRDLKKVNGIGAFDTMIYYSEQGNIHVVEAF